MQLPGQTTGSIGIGFAIPSEEASRLAGELIAGSKPTHAVLGITVSNSATTTSGGVVVQSVARGGPAAKAGLKVGDAVSAIGDQRVSTADALVAAVRARPPGTEVALTYARAGNGATAQVVLGSSTE